MFSDRISIIVTFHLYEEIELAIAKSLPGSYVFTHLEPLEDPLSWQDQQLDHLP